MADLARDAIDAAAASFDGRGGDGGDDDDDDDAMEAGEEEAAAAVAAEEEGRCDCGACSGSGGPFRIPPACLRRPASELGVVVPAADVAAAALAAPAAASDEEAEFETEANANAAEARDDEALAAVAASLDSSAAAAHAAAAAVAERAAAACAAMSSSTSVVSEVVVALDTIALILGNALSAPKGPSGDKFRCIKQNNPAFVRRAGRLRGSTELLRAAGFAPSGADGGELKLTRDDPALLYVVRSAVCDAVERARARC